MKYRPMWLAILVIGASVAWCQCPTVPGTAAVTQETAYSLPDAMNLCPSGTVAIVPACPVTVAHTIGGDPAFMVLGSQETLVLGALPVEDITWRDVPSAYQSHFEEGNPLFYSRPNRVVTRHGNPYFPYFALGPQVNVAGTMERYSALAGTLTPADRSALETVGERYRNLTIEQARVLGYEQVAVPRDQGVVFLNRALLDNVLEPLRPEAFVFDRQGRIVGAQYYLVTPAPVVAFGQATNASALVAGGQQLNVWLYRTNPNGLFAERHPDLAR